MGNRPSEWQSFGGNHESLVRQISLETGFCLQRSGLSFTAIRVTF
jgi:hypothetical protein